MIVGNEIITAAAAGFITDGMRDGLKSTFGGETTALGEAMALKFAALTAIPSTLAIIEFIKQGKIVGTIPFTGTCTAGVATGVLTYTGNEMTIF